VVDIYKSVCDRFAIVVVSVKKSLGVSGVATSVRHI
jgi:hypothetical protein